MSRASRSSGREQAPLFDHGFRGAGEIRRATDETGQFLRNLAEQRRRRGTGGDLLPDGETGTGELHGLGIVEGIPQRLPILPGIGETLGPTRPSRPAPAHGVCEEGVDQVVHEERLLRRIAHALLGEADLLFTKWRTMGRGGVLGIGRAMRDVSATRDQGRSLLLCDGSFYRLGDRLPIVAVHLGGVPADSIEASEDVLAERDVGAAVDGDVVVVIEIDEATQAEMAGKRGGLAAHSLHQVAVGHEGEGAMVDEVGAEAGPQVAFRDAHPHCGREALAEGAGRHLDAESMVDLGMARSVAAPLPEVAKVVEGQRKPAEVEQGIEEHRSMAVGKNEAVTIRPLGLVGVNEQIAAPKHHCDVRHAHRHPRVTAVRLLHGVHGQRLDGVDR